MSAADLKPGDWIIIVRVSPFGDRTYATAEVRSVAPLLIRANGYCSSNHARFRVVFSSPDEDTAKFVCGELQRAIANRDAAIAKARVSCRNTIEVILRQAQEQTDRVRLAMEQTK